MVYNWLSPRFVTGDFLLNKKSVANCNALLKVRDVITQLAAQMR